MNPRLRLMAIEDISKAVRLSDIAGWNQRTADWERFLSADLKGCFAAECEGRIVGTSATIIYEGRFAWIGMVVVDPQHRGQGLGTLLLERAIQHLDLQRVPCAVNQQVALMLLNEFLHRSGRELVFVDCLGRNPWAVPVLKARGFAFSRPLTRMFRGANNYPGRPDLLCDVLGPEFG
jgi:GNAT superfamily N-acetyltransferase